MSENKQSNALTNWTPMSLDELENQERQIGFGQGGGQFYQFKDGKNVVRFLPGLYGKQPFVTFWKHFVKGSGDGKAYGGPCPLKMAKLPCVVCAVAAKLSRGSDADRDLAGDIGSRSRVIASLIDRSAPDAGPQVAEFGKTVYDPIKDYMRTMGEDPTHPNEGFDMVIEKHGSGLKTEYKVMPQRKNSPLHSDARQMTDWLNEAADLGQHITLLPEHEQVAKLAGTIIGHMLGGRSAPAGRQDHGRREESRGQRVSARDALDVDDDDVSY